MSNGGGGACQAHTCSAALRARHPSPRPRATTGFFLLQGKPAPTSSGGGSSGGFTTAAPAATPKGVPASAGACSAAPGNPYPPSQVPATAGTAPGVDAVKPPGQPPPPAHVARVAGAWGCVSASARRLARVRAGCVCLWWLRFTAGYVPLSDVRRNAQHHSRPIQRRVRVVQRQGAAPVRDHQVAVAKVGGAPRVPCACVPC